MAEFDIINTYFTTQKKHRHDVIRGIGDDAALVSVPHGQELAITTDTLIEGVHFPHSTSPSDIGYKSLAVNLSDIAAMGATPAWSTLALTLPNKNKEWLQAFCEGFFSLANEYQTDLIGGDLTHGPLSITVQLLGLVPTQTAILRSQAKPNDLIYVTGTLGDAGLGLKCIQEKIELQREHQLFVTKRLNRPTPNIKTGVALRHIAHAAIDISDGLAADLNHILKASHVGAKVYVDKLPLSIALKASLSYQEALTLALTAGDDYELCFTIPKEKQTELEKKLSSICSYTCIGMITEELGLDLCYQNGNQYHGPIQGYEHF